jgi:adenylate cyclase
MLASTGLAASYAVGAQLFFGRADVWLPLAVPVLVQLPLLLFMGLLYQRKNIWRAIRIFVPDKVAKQTAEHPRDPIAVKQTAFATCLASDAEDYTALSERMAPAEAAAFLNDYFEALTLPLRRQEADFREFHADSMLSAWIANTPDVSVRKRACLAALEALDAIDAFNARKAPLHLGIRLGLHAGEIFLGNVGAGGRFAFRLVGDIVNTASRIESLNKVLGTRLLATEAVVAEVDGLLLRPLGQFRLKGRRTATPVVEILSTQEHASAAQITLCAQFARALQAYQEAGGCHEAAEHFRAVLEQFPEDGAARFYLHQCLSRIASSATEDDATIIRIDTNTIAPVGTILDRQT